MINEPKKAVPPWVAEVAAQHHAAKSVSRLSLTHIEPIKQDTIKEHQADPVQIWALGIITVIGGQFYGWNSSFSTGFVPFCIAQVLMAAAFVMYVSCISEVGGKVPGGSYGLARAVLGFYPGFLLGCLEILEYTSLASVSVLYVVEFVSDFFAWSPIVQPFLWFVFYAIAIAILHLPGKYLWRFIHVFVILCLLPVPLYILSAAPSANFYENAIFNSPPAPDDPTNSTTSFWATGELNTAFFALLPATTVGYAGIESLTVVTDFVRNPMVTVPRGTVAAVWTLLLTNFTLLFLVPSLPPGVAEITDHEYLMDNGLALGFGFSPSLSRWLIMPAQMGMAFGFFIPYARLTQAMANSNLLPTFFNLKGQTSTLKAMIISSLFGYCLCLISYFSSEFEDTLQNISVLAGTICYCAQIYGFVLLRTSYKIECTGYKSPFGLFGACFAWVMFGLLSISIAGGFQGDNGIAIISLIVFVLFLTVYYVRVCRDIQTVSPEEYASIFKFSVMKFNKLRKSRSSRSRSASFKRLGNTDNNFRGRAKVYIQT